MKGLRVKPVVMWAAISYDEPPDIWYVASYRRGLPANLRKIRVRVSPISIKRVRKP